MTEELIRFSHVSMQFPTVLANDDVSFAINSGEIFALIGENGAGKSTLMNLLFGILTPTIGEIFISNESVGPNHTPQKAMSKGINMVHQHFTLVDSYTVAQNIFLGHEPTKKLFFYDQQAVCDKVDRLCLRYGLKLDPRAYVKDLSVGEKQRVEILKALRDDTRLLILDEPTAVLTPQETQALFAVLQRMVESQNMTILLITHKLDEVMQISDRIGVLRRGRYIQTLSKKEADKRTLSSLMVGHEVEPSPYHLEPISPMVVLQIKNLSAENSQGATILSDINFSVHAGEIVGICGVEGNGQSELAECIMGLFSTFSGEIKLDNVSIAHSNTNEIRKQGLSFIPEDRMHMGSDLQASVEENIVVGKHRNSQFRNRFLALKPKAIESYASKQAEIYDVRTSSLDSPVNSLSGGNVQKVVIAREFANNSKAMIISQPTRGVDIGASKTIHDSIIKKRNEGAAILLLSADMDELCLLSDRIITIYEGKITGCFDASKVTKETLGLAITANYTPESSL